MEIHIDTRRDSDEEIRKTIKFLQSLIGDTPTAPTNVFENSDSSAPMNMFGGDESSPSPAPMNMFGSDDDAPSDYSPGDSGETVEEEDAVIEIVEY